MNEPALFDSLLAVHGAPTLAGIKTANLFPVRSDQPDMVRELRRANRVLADKGMRLIPLRKRKESTLMYLFRPQKLREDLCDPEAERILQEKGYPCPDPVKCICQLIRHLNKDEQFPHEIGLFLGYPPSDVRCFMEDSREGVQCTGCWKAYSNKEKAEETFRRYKACTRIYVQALKKGKTLESLSVRA